MIPTHVIDTRWIPISRCIPDNENTIFVFRVKDDGTTDLPEEMCQGVGVEGQPQMWTENRKITNVSSKSSTNTCHALFDKTASQG
jgi:hypothetical protein